MSPKKLMNTTMDNIKTIHKEEIPWDDIEECFDETPLFIDNVAMDIFPDMLFQERDSFRNEGLTDDQKYAIAADKSYRAAIELAKAKLKYNTSLNID